MTFSGLPEMLRIAESKTYFSLLPFANPFPNISLPFAFQKSERSIGRLKKLLVVEQPPWGNPTNLGGQFFDSLAFGRISI